MPPLKTCYSCYLVTSTIMSVTGLLPAVTEGTPPRKPCYPRYPVTTPIPAITTLLPTVTNHRPARNTQDAMAIHHPTCRSSITARYRVTRNTRACHGVEGYRDPRAPTHAEANIGIIEVHHTAHVNHSVTDRDGTHNHDGVTDRYTTRSPVEARLTRSHIAHDKPYARTYVRTLEPR